ncbi:hypothetical protein [Planctomicrobium piriforme]|uniref:Uncharacterized protein n=1 Tax=Planctomicrobium piriforme TaxID=1576369 RepID=A0A1I3EB00_9PLAN|nr:hypothetical protein [Planctomicrobium piriforme]SFH96115.1 hypothetical protein SAMN05421753_104146 [Planctomicrobium piriforme]
MDKLLEGAWNYGLPGVFMIGSLLILVRFGSWLGLNIFIPLRDAILMHFIDLKDHMKKVDERMSVQTDITRTLIDSQAQVVNRQDQHSQLLQKLIDRSAT